ncbi:MAG: hypothetical protein J6X98_02075 [Bacteroidales bacterium]|nr:hypothetical protein [Bacteroidales bacterium]
MKRINYQQGILAIIAVMLFAFTTVSCNRTSKNRVCKHWSIETVHSFPNTNWAFEEEVLDFPFEIKDTTRSYDVSVILRYDTSVVTLTDIPLSLTLSAPDGMKSFSASHFLLDMETNKDIKMVDGHAEATVLVYPSRKFKNLGTHTLTVYRRAEKADNYGFISLATKVAVAK